MLTLISSTAGDFDPIARPLSLAVGTKDSLLDMGSVGKIQDLLAKKTEIPHEVQVYPSPHFYHFILNLHLLASRRLS